MDVLINAITDQLDKRISKKVANTIEESLSLDTGYVVVNGREFPVNNTTPTAGSFYRGMYCYAYDKNRHCAILPKELADDSDFEEY